MILYKYTADCSATEYNEVKMNKKKQEELFSCRSDITEINSAFYTEYSIDKKYMIAVTDILRGRMTIVAAHDFEVNPGQVEGCIRAKLPGVKIMKSEEITLEVFCQEITRAERNNWTERGRRTIITDLGLNVEPEGFSFFDGPPYRLEEKIYTADGTAKRSVKQRLRDILASEGFIEEISRIYSNENEKRFLGHPVHYLISAGDKGAADDMLDILIPALMANKRLESGRVCSITDLKSKAYREENFFNIFPETG